MGPFGTVYAQCLRGMAARNRLDIVAALQNFRTAFEVGTAVGPTRTRRGLRVRCSPNCSTRPAIWPGLVVSWTRAICWVPRGCSGLPGRQVRDRRAGQGGPGDHEGAADRLSTGGDTAVQLGLPRLAARINNERIRLGIALPAAVAADLLAPRTIPATMESPP